MPLQRPGDIRELVTGYESSDSYYKITNKYEAKTSWHNSLITTEITQYQVIIEEYLVIWPMREEHQITMTNERQPSQLLSINNWLLIICVVCITRVLPIW